MRCWRYRPKTILYVCSNTVGSGRLEPSIELWDFITQSVTGSLLSLLLHFLLIPATLHISVCLSGVIAALDERNVSRVR